MSSVPLTASATGMEDGLSVISGQNIILQSAFLRMTLVATSTVVFVSAITFFTIGLCDLTATDADVRNESTVLVVGGALMLVTSVFQFVVVCIWSGWCTILPARGFRMLSCNQILVNGQLLTTRPRSSLRDTDLGIVVTEGGNVIAPTGICSSPRHLIVTKDEKTALAPIKVDASTSTRGEVVVWLSPRGNAPMAVQEEITPSLRSSFQSIDELA